MILMLILGVDFPIAWGVLFFFLNFIPNLGSLLDLVPPAIVAFLEYGWETALVVIGYYVFHLVGEYMIRPRFMKIRVRYLNPDVHAVTDLLDLGPRTGRRQQPKKTKVERPAP